jgi:hypothetical protein
MRWWLRDEDGKQADSWRMDSFGGNYVTEEFRVGNVPPVCSVWKTPALVVRMYDDGHWGLSEKEWRSG